MQIIHDMSASEIKTSEEAMNCAQSMMALYAEAREHARGLDEKERGPADELVPLAVAVLVGATAR